MRAIGRTLRIRVKAVHQTQTQRDLHTETHQPRYTLAYHICIIGQSLFSRAFLDFVDMSR